MKDLKEGIYEEVINSNLKETLEKNKEKYFSCESEIDEAESSKILSDYLSDVIKSSLDILGEKSRKDKGPMQKKIEFINKIVGLIDNEIKDDSDIKGKYVENDGNQLLSLVKKENSIYSISRKNTGKNSGFISRPETSISQSSLFTGAVHEPQMQSELKKEILSSDRIDILVSFIKWSGLRIIINELKEFTEKGGILRIITTSYMGATDVKAVEELSRLANTTVKVSYDTKITRLHAKSYIFHRDSGFSTAYVGSSNISNAALTSGLEWNVKITRKDLPETMEKIEATFESYWNSKEFEIYDENGSLRLKDAIISEKRKDTYLKDSENRYIMDVRPYSYQQEVLDRLNAERKIRNRYRNLIVAATGVGKTVISAFDYRNFKEENEKNGKCRLLFIAHREEILKQSLETFRAVLKDSNFGDICTGRNEPESIDHLFITIQSFNSRNFTENTSSDFYDYIVIDEFHHAAAKSYDKLLKHYSPKILLGLTATPERMDGKHNELYEIFDNNIAAEIRLPEAIDRKLLCPFQYFGVSDDTDLREIRWSRGGYDVKELNNVYVLDRKVAEKRAGNIVQNTLKYVNDIEEVKGIGFCVSIEHAKFMSDYFNGRNIKSIYLTGNSSPDERNSAKKRLVNGEIKFIFVVDLYNEGVDIPEINTVLFLRPTESLTVFLQQLGRGLRLSDGKDCLTVLDFIGQANKNYNFSDKFSALLSDKNENIKTQIEKGFTRVPRGCFIQLEKKARKWVLENIKDSIGNINVLTTKIGNFESDTGLKLNLENFVKYYHLDIRDLYKKGSFYRMCVNAGVRESFDEKYEDVITKAFKRLVYCNSKTFIDFITDILSGNRRVDIEKFNGYEIRMLQMFNVTVWGKDYENGSISDEQSIHLIRESENMCSEIMELLEYNRNNIDFISGPPVDIGFECPLEIHCSYTRDQVLVAFGDMKPSSFREGVKWFEKRKTDVFFITLNKSDKDYSPTTLYKDYSINEYLFHWQSQNKTSDTSPTGERYINHKKMGSNVLLFVREHNSYKKSNITEAYTFLGKANFVSYTGSKPMNIVWRLDYPVPASMINKTSKLLLK